MTFLDTHEVYAVYIPSNKIEHDLPSEVIEQYKQLHTNYPTTTVMNDADAGMDATYIADTKLWTKNKLSEIVAEQLKTNELILERTV